MRKNKDENRKKKKNQRHSLTEKRGIYYIFVKFNNWNHKKTTSPFLRQNVRQWAVDVQDTHMVKKQFKSRSHNKLSRWNVAVALFGAAPAKHVERFSLSVRTLKLNNKTSIDAKWNTIT